MLADLRSIIGDYRSHGELLREFIVRDIRVRYKQAVMGLLWAILMPTLLVAIGLGARVAFLGGTSALTAEVVGGIAVRSALWSGFAAAVSFGTASLVANATLVGKVYFPREVLPLSAVLSNGLDTAVALGVCALALPWLGARGTLALIWVPVVLALWLGAAWAAALFLSAANLFFRDVKYLVQALLSVGVLVTPVFFSAHELRGRAAALIAWNPLTPLLDGITLVLFEGHHLGRPLGSPEAVLWTPWHLGVTALLVLGSLVVGSLVFHRAEDLFAERV